VAISTSFLAGRPTFRKYDANGSLVFERLIQGSELDDFLASQPRDGRAKDRGREVPFVNPVVRTPLSILRTYSG
jgi:hypothetical protein